MRAVSVLGSLTGVFLFAPNATRAQAPAKFEFEVASVRASALGFRDRGRHWRHDAVGLGRLTQGESPIPTSR